MHSTVKHLRWALPPEYRRSFIAPRCCAKATSKCTWSFACVRLGCTWGTMPGNATTIVCSRKTSRTGH